LIAVPRIVHVVPSGDVCTCTWSVYPEYPVSWYTHRTADAVADPAGTLMFAVLASRVLFPLVAVYELNIDIPAPLCGVIPVGCVDVVTLVQSPVVPVTSATVHPVGGNVAPSKLSVNTVVTGYVRFPTVIVNVCVQGPPPVAAEIASEKLITVPHVTPDPTEYVKCGALHAALAPAAMFGYVAVAPVTVIPGVAVDSVALIPVAPWLPMFFKVGWTVMLSPASMIPLLFPAPPLPHVSVKVFDR
jgi:hypothetical protein